MVTLYLMWSDAVNYALIRLDEYHAFPIIERFGVLFSCKYCTLHRAKRRGKNPYHNEKGATVCIRHTAAPCHCHPSPLFEVCSVLHQNLQPLFAVYFMLAVNRAVDGDGHVRLYLILAVTVQRQVQGRLCVF